MKIDFLGHSELILEMENTSGRTVRILFDSWLTDYAYGDYLARNPSLHLDFDSLPKLDAIYLTHPHCDHFDPYSLVEIYKRQNPALLLPETVSFLRPVLNEMLNQPEMFFFRHNEKIRLFGIHFQAWSFSNPFHTNEEDVMMLFLHNQKEALFYEADAAVPETPRAWDHIYESFTEFPFETRLYLATRNELEALFLSYDHQDPAIRERKLNEYFAKRDEEIEWEFFRSKESEGEFPDVWSLSGLHRVLVGQGIVFPPQIDERFLELSQPLPLSRVAEKEMQMAGFAGSQLSVHAASPGEQFHWEHGKLQKRTDSFIRKNMVQYDTPYNKELKIKFQTAKKPLRDEERNVPVQLDKILHALNERLLPYLFLSLEEPLKELLAEKPCRCYLIEVITGCCNAYNSIYYLFTYETMKFIQMNEKPPHAGSPWETYFANDLEDFLEGSQDVFSNSPVFYEKEEQKRFWSVLGLPFLNRDLVEKRLRLHFERARNGETVESFVLPPVKSIFLQ